MQDAAQPPHWLPSGAGRASRGRAGLFYSFVEEASVRLIGVEAGGHGVNSAKHAATLTRGSPGVLHGSYSYLLQTEEGQVINPHSISAG